MSVKAGLTRTVARAVARAGQPDLLLWLSFFKGNCPSRAHILCNKFFCPGGVVGATLIALGMWRDASVKLMQTSFILFCQYKTQEYAALQKQEKGSQRGISVNGPPPKPLGKSILSFVQWATSSPALMRLICDPGWIRLQQLQPAVMKEPSSVPYKSNMWEITSSSSTEADPRDEQLFNCVRGYQNFCLNTYRNAVQSKKVPNCRAPSFRHVLNGDWRRVSAHTVADGG